MVTLGDFFGGISPHLMLQRLNSQAGRSTVFVSEAVQGLKKSGFGEALSPASSQSVSRGRSLLKHSREMVGIWRRLD